MSFKRRGTATVLDGLRQDGCLKARFPHVDPPHWPGAVTLNRKRCAAPAVGQKLPGVHLAAAVVVVVRPVT